MAKARTLLWKPCKLDVFSFMSLPPLSPDQLVKPRHFELRMGFLFAAAFFPLGIFLPYFPLWLQGNGFDAEQIGIILSAPLFLRIVATPLITAFADRAKDRADVLTVLVAGSLLLSFGFFLPPAYSIVLTVSLLLAVVWPPHSPLADSLALSGVRRFGSSYTAMRIWGSVTYLLANLIGGVVLAASSAQTVPLMMSLGLAAALAASFFVPRLGRPRKASPLSAANLQDATPKLLNGYFTLFIAGAGVIIGSHGFLYGFVSIYWRSIGVSETVVGFLWAWSVFAEVAIFMVFTRIFGSISAPSVVMLAGAAAVVRWAAFPLIHPLGLGAAGFFAIQSLHALSTGLILIGLQKLIADTVPEDKTGAAQGAAFFANGFAMASVTLLAGPLYDRLGVDGFYVMGVIALAGLALVALAARSAPERCKRRRHH